MPLTNIFTNVYNWMHTFGQYVRDEPGLPLDDGLYNMGLKTMNGIELREGRMELLREEYHEYLQAEKDNDIVEVADALGDMVVIIAGTAAVYGIDMVPVLDEIMRSNWAKRDERGNVLFREDGKILKPDTWTPPAIAEVLSDQTRSTPPE